MAKTALILGARLNLSKILEGYEQKIVKTIYGNALLFVKGKSVILLRHGKSNIPAHRINHKANICALNLEGVERIFSVCPVESLSLKLKPGSFIVVDDYVNFQDETFFEMDSKSIVPGISEELRKHLLAMAKKKKILVKTSGVYVQTRGPRFETKAEIRVLQKWGDVVGMTMGTEATLAREIGLPYASLCYVIQFANGVGKASSVKTAEATRVKSQTRAEKIAQSLLV